MHNSDTSANRDALRTAMQRAAASGDSAAFAQAFEDLAVQIGDELRQEFADRLEATQQMADGQVMAGRGIRQLTSKEREYYQKLIGCMQASDPKQALTGANLSMPVTIVNTVFDEAINRYSCVSVSFYTRFTIIRYITFPIIIACIIDFVPSGGALRMIMDTNGNELATWGALCDEIVKEIAAGFKLIDGTLYKLSAFLPVCKAMLELGAEWLDRYIRDGEIDDAETKALIDKKHRANLFKLQEFASKEKEFFLKLDNICFDGSDFNFTFNYKNFNTSVKDYRNIWTVSSRGSRLKYNKQTRETEEFLPTEEIRKAFYNAGIDFQQEMNLVPVLKDLPETPANKTLFRKLFEAFRLTLQMRNSRANKTGKEDDYLLSPVKGENGIYYDSRTASENLPQDADANGAFHIAQKGRMLIERLKEDVNKADLFIKNEDFLEYMQR